MRILVRLIAVSLLATAGSCALIDSFTGDDDETSNPGRIDSGPEPFGDCEQAVILGDLTNGASVGPFSSCPTSINIDFSLCEPEGGADSNGMIFGFLVEEGEYTICVAASGPGFFSVREGSCSETPVDSCDLSGNCANVLLGPGPVHIYWQPEGDQPCGDVAFDINPILAADE